MSVCAKCTNAVTKKSPGLRCFVCRGFFHANSRCPDVSKNQLTYINNVPGGRWDCPNCRRDPVADPPVGSADDGEESEDAEIEDVNPKVVQLMKSVRSELAAVRNEIKDLKRSVVFCSDKVSDFEEKISKIDEALGLTHQLKAENESLKKELSAFSARLNVIEQEARCNNLEIMDVPQKTGENLFDIVGKVGKFLGHEVSVGDISSVTRVPTKIPNKPKNIVSKLKSRIDRDNLLAAVKIKRAAQGGRSGFEVEGVSDRLFINEHLTTVNKILFKEARAAAKAKSYRYVWTQNGSILMRKNDTSRILQIYRSDDLERLA